MSALTQERRLLMWATGVLGLVYNVLVFIAGAWVAGDAGAWKCAVASVGIGCLSTVAKYYELLAEKEWLHLRIARYLFIIAMGLGGFAGWRLI